MADGFEVLCRDAGREEAGAGAREMIGDRTGAVGLEELDHGMTRR